MSILLSYLLGVPWWVAAGGYPLAGLLWALLYLPRTIQHQVTRYAQWRERSLQGETLGEFLQRSWEVETTFKHRASHPSPQQFLAEARGFTVWEPGRKFCLNVIFWPVLLPYYVLTDYTLAIWQWAGRQAAKLGRQLLRLGRWAARRLDAVCAVLGRMVRWIGHHLMRFVRWIGRGLRWLGRQTLRGLRCLGRGIKMLWQCVDAFLHLLGRILTILVEQLEQLIHWFGELLSRVGRQVERLFRWVGRQVMRVARWAGRQVLRGLRWLSRVLDGLCKQVARFFRWIGRLLNDFCRQIGRFARWVGRQVVRFFRGLWNFVFDFWGSVVVPLYRRLYAYFTGIYRSIISWANREALADMKKLQTAKPAEVKND